MATTMPSAPRDLGPTGTDERIVALDVLRGFALFGVFVVNASVSARPFEEAVNPPRDGSSSEMLAWALVVGAFVTKFVALFSLLFGMGLALQCRRIEARGGSTRIFLRRLAWLGLFGLLHGFLLFEGDILFPYALIGAGAYALRRRSTRLLLGTAAVLYATGLGLQALQLIPESVDPQRALFLARAHHEGSLALVLQARASDYLGWLLVSSVTLFHWQIAALFLFGLVVIRLDLLRAERLPWHRRAAGLGLFVGAALVLLAAFLERWPTLATVGFELGSLALAAGYTGTVLWIVHRGFAPGIQRSLARTGRLALTNYVSQSVLMHLVFFEALGLGLWDRLTRWQVLGLVVTLFAAQVAFSLLWTRRFAQGPLEGLWRRLTYGRG